jgi:catechol 2,3-dioxygenase-like lactoylglutathione lyase family enzyme
MAHFCCLCLDTADPASDLATFWAAVSGGRVAPAESGGPADVHGRAENENLLIVPVPEPKTVKNRVHLDVYALAIDDLTARGASVVLPAEESGFAWTVMRDPEGNEFCAFLRDELPDFRIHGVVIDSADPERIATWWGDVLGAEVSDNAEHGGGWWTLLGATPDPVLTWDFVPVPEPKTVKNRLHWDLRGSVDDLLERGATHRWDRPGWTALADPEGNEFCVLPEE